MDKFKKYNISATPEQQKMVSDYLLEIKNYVEKNNLDIELYNDIEEIVFEKILALKQVNSLNLQKIIKEVWDIESIFGDSTQKTSQKNRLSNSKQDEYFYEKLWNNNWSIIPEQTLILWVCGLLAEKIWVSRFIVRFIVLLSFLFWGITLWMYFFAAVVLPQSHINYDKMNEWSYIWYQIKSIFKKFFRNLFGSIFGKSSHTPNENKISQDDKNSTSLLQMTWIIIRFVIFISIAFWLLGIVVMWLLALGIIASDATIAQINISQAFSPMLLWWLITSTTGLFIWMLTSTMFAIKGKSGWFLLNIFAGILVAISFVFGIAGSIQLMSNFESSKTYSKETLISQTSSGDTIINLDWLNQNNILWMFDGWKITVKSSNDQSIKLIRKISFVGQNTHFETLQWSLSDIEITQEENTFFLNYKNNAIYKNTVPPHFADIEYVLYLPKTWSYMIENSYNFYLQNVENISNSEYQNKKYHSNNCENTFFSYDETKKSFVCKQ